jgi:hypothetical protein
MNLVDGMFEHLQHKPKMLEEEFEQRKVVQEKLLSLIEDYGNPFTGVYRRELLMKEILQMVEEHVQ